MTPDSDAARSAAARAILLYAPELRAQAGVPASADGPTFKIVDARDDRHRPAPFYLHLGAAAPLTPAPPPAPAPPASASNRRRR